MDDQITPSVVKIELAGQSYDWSAPARRLARNMRASMRDVVPYLPDVLMKRMGDMPVDAKPEDVLDPSEVLVLLPELAQFSLVAIDWLSKYNEQIPRDAYENASDLEILAAFFAVFGLLTGPFDVPTEAEAGSPSTQTSNAESTNE